MSSHSFRPGPALAGCLLALVSSAPAAQSGTLLTNVAGKVLDMSVDSGGNLLYCTSGKSVGRIALDGQVTVLATAASGPFPDVLRGVVENPAGDIAVIDTAGDIYVLPGGSPPAALIYDDLYMIESPSDLIVDASGNYVVPSQSPTSGIRAVNWVSEDGSLWAYYLVDLVHKPLALAQDALGLGLLMADTADGGSLLRIDGADGSHPVTTLDDTTKPGFGTTQMDGDIAALADGDALFIAQDRVYHFDRQSGVTTVIDSGYTELKALAVAASSGNVPSASGFSAYVADFVAPTMVYEIPDVGAPAPTPGPSLGTIPGQGIQHFFWGNIRTYEITADREGHLLAGGDFFGTNPRIKRVELPSLTVTDVAHGSDGLSGKIEGIVVDVDGTIYASTSDGVIHTVVEGPSVQVDTLYDDAGDLVGRAKDLARDRQGNLYMADIEGYGFGDVDKVTAEGVGSSLGNTVETRGACADPFNGTLFVTEWNDIGFHGTVGRMDVSSGDIVDVPGFAGMNYTNAAGWGDGDLVMDVEATSTRARRTTSRSTASTRTRASCSASAPATWRASPASPSRARPPARGAPRAGACT